MALITQNEAMIYHAVREAADGIIEIDAHNKTWCNVHTSRIILRGSAMNWKQLAGYLSALQRKGLYKRLNRDCGAIWLKNLKG